ncbi:vacuolar protein sorting 29 [Aspergillus niger]|uniref:Vacuolar protein sorting-associated protein 29 n=1 Tax=Aspergillus niger TaxID=5061 RepID=A0A100IHM8_ASPNG|nr:vacuolar protein sorting 29 [Aspergillus niger]
MSARLCWTDNNLVAYGAHMLSWRGVVGLPFDAELRGALVLFQVGLSLQLDDDLPSIPCTWNPLNLLPLSLPLHRIITMATQEPKPAVVCVFCGSYPGNSPSHLEAARALAQDFHKHNVQLVYGGGTVGIMGELAKTLVSLSGPKSVQGIIPQALVEVEEGYKGSAADTQSKEGKAAERVVNQSVQESNFGMVTIVPDMHTRKRLMAQKVLEGGPGSGFVALAGGFGTMEELMEMTTWNQLGIHKAGIVLLNINGYWNGILQWIQAAVKEGLVSPENARIIAEATKVEEVLKMLREYQISSDLLVIGDLFIPDRAPVRIPSSLIASSQVDLSADLYSLGPPGQGAHFCSIPLDPPLCFAIPRSRLTRAQFRKLLTPGKIGQILCLGNLTDRSTFEFLRQVAPDLQLVKGDFDVDSPNLPLSKVVTHGSLRIGFTHGHTIIPPGDADALLIAARQMDVDILLWGGTHRFEAFELEGRFFINPGSATGAMSTGYWPEGEEPTPSFCLMDIQGDVLVLYVYQLKTDVNGVETVAVEKVSYRKNNIPSS